MPLPYTKLNPFVQKAKGEGTARFAPHKPLLLLVLIDMAEAGEIHGPRLEKTAGLRLRFDSYWAICQPRWGGSPGLDLPFHYLSSQGFWKARTKEDTTSRGPHSTHAIELCEELLADLSDKKRRDQVRHTLVQTWFPEGEQRALYSALGFSSAKLRQLEWSQEPDKELETTGRTARFRVGVVTQYQFTCALTGYGLHTQLGHTLVEAAHIHAFSKSRNNDLVNGLALTRDAHWMFDRGLWTISPDFKVLVAEEIFTEWGEDVAWLHRRNHKQVKFRDGVVLRPAERHLAWHREHIFQKC